MRGLHWHAGIAVAGLIAISLCLTVTILELMKLKREALAEAAQKEEAGKALNGPPFRHSHPSQVTSSCQRRRIDHPVNIFIHLGRHVSVPSSSLQGK